jgi:hypothetical protein
MKYPCFLSDFNEIILDRFSKNTQISNFIRICPAEAELFRSDVRTDMTKLIVAFGSAANCLKLIYSGLLEYWRRLGGARNGLHFA